MRSSSLLTERDHLQTAWTCASMTLRILHPLNHPLRTCQIMFQNPRKLYPLREKCRKTTNSSSGANLTSDPTTARRSRKPACPPIVGLLKVLYKMSHLSPSLPEMSVQNAVIRPEKTKTNSKILRS